MLEAARSAAQRGWMAPGITEVSQGNIQLFKIPPAMNQLSMRADRCHQDAHEGNYPDQPRCPGNQIGQKLFPGEFFLPHAWVYSCILLVDLARIRPIARVSPVNTVAITAERFGSRARKAKTYILNASTVEEPPGPPPVAV